MPEGIKKGLDRDDDVNRTVIKPPCLTLKTQVHLKYLLGSSQRMLYSKHIQIIDGYGTVHQSNHLPSSIMGAANGVPLRRIVLKSR